MLSREGAPHSIPTILNTPPPRDALLPPHPPRRPAHANLAPQTHAARCIELRCECALTRLAFYRRHPQSITSPLLFPSPFPLETYCCGCWRMESMTWAAGRRVKGMRSCALARPTAARGTRTRKTRMVCASWSVLFLCVM